MCPTLRSSGEKSPERTLSMNCFITSDIIVSTSSVTPSSDPRTIRTEERVRKRAGCTEAHILREEPDRVPNHNTRLSDRGKSGPSGVANAAATDHFVHRIYGSVNESEFQLVLIRGTRRKISSL